jgi:hypothetical protein
VPLVRKERELTTITQLTIIQRITGRGKIKAVIEATVMTTIIEFIIHQAKVAEAIEENAVVVAVVKSVMAVETVRTINDSTTMILALFMADTNGENVF